MQDGINVNRRIFRRCAISATQVLLTAQRWLQQRPVLVFRMRRRDYSDDLRHMEKPQEVYREDVNMKVTDEIEIHLRVRELLETPINVTLQLIWSPEGQKTPTYVELYSAEQIRSLHEAFTKVVEKLDVLQGVTQPQPQPQGLYYPPGVRSGAATGNVQIVKDKHGETQVVINPTSQQVRSAHSFNSGAVPPEPLELADPFESVDGAPVDG